MNEPIINEEFSLHDIMDYIKNNIMGLLLLGLTVVIIITVDYLNRLNYLNQSPNFSSTILPGLQFMQFKPRKFRKFKK